MPEPASPEEKLRALLLDLLVYAPIGMAYEYDHIREILVRRGKSQVDIARLMAQMAANRRGVNLEQEIEDGLRDLRHSVASVITELGQIFGLAPKATPDDDDDDDDDDDEPEHAKPEYHDERPPAGLDDYDSLTAKEIRAKLTLLSPTELAWVREREQAGKQRKTVLDRVDGLLP